MGDLGGPTSQLTSSSFGRDVKLGVPRDAACTEGPNKLSVARNPDKPTQNKLKTTPQTSMELREWDATIQINKRLITFLSQSLILLELSKMKILFLLLKISVTPSIK